MMECEAVAEMCVALAREHHPDAIVILGDTLDTHEVIRTFPFKLACDFFERMAQIAQTYVLIGNHDYINASQFLTDNHPFNPMKYLSNLTIVDAPVITTINDMKFIMCPYVPPGRFMEALETLPSGSLDGCKCIFAHQEFRGSAYGSTGVSECGDEWTLDLPRVISGHIHEASHLSKIGVYYTGTPYQQEYAASPEKHVWLTTFKSKNPEPFIEKLSLGLRGKIEMTFEINESVGDDAIEEFHRKLEDVIDQHDVRVILTGNKSVLNAFRSANIFATTLKNMNGVRIAYKYTDDATAMGVGDVPKKERENFEKVFRRLVEDTKNKDVIELYKSTSTSG